MDETAFASRPAQPGDLPFIVSSFVGSYAKAGHIGGMRDVFPRFFARPFVKLVQASSPMATATIATLVVYPLAEPTEIAGYMVWSPVHCCLVYLLVKPALCAGAASAALSLALAGMLPRMNSDNLARFAALLHELLQHNASSRR